MISEHERNAAYRQMLEESERKLARQIDHQFSKPFVIVACMVIGLAFYGVIMIAGGLYP
jgi:hypothetical protein